MKRRQTTESIGVGAFLQILVVGVLLFAVIWQLSSTVETAPRDVDTPTIAQDAPISRSFMTTEDVNLRRGPGTDHEVISVVPMHAEVVVTGEGQNGFLPVAIDGTSAWVSRHYLVPEGAVLAASSGDVPTEPPAPVIEEPVVIAPEQEPQVPDVPEVAVEVPKDPDPPVEAPSVAVAAQIYTEPVEETVTEEPGERWVEVNRTTRTVTLYEGRRVVAQFDGLIGKDPSPDGYYSTAVGTFYVHSMTRELAETPFAEGVYLTHFVGFDAARSNGFHSPTRDADGNVIQTGGTATLGCVRLSEADAIRMFEFAYIGMRVEVHD